MSFISFEVLLGWVKKTRPLDPLIQSECSFMGQGALVVRIDPCACMDPLSKFLGPNWKAEHAIVDVNDIYEFRRVHVSNATRLRRIGRAGLARAPRP